MRRILLHPDGAEGGTTSATTAATTPGTTAATTAATTQTTTSAEMAGSENFRSRLRAGTSEKPKPSLLPKREGTTTLGTTAETTAATTVVTTPTVTSETTKRIVKRAKNYGNDSGEKLDKTIAAVTELTQTIVEHGRQRLEPPKGPELTGEQKKGIAILTEIEALNPTKYGGLVARATEAAPKIVAFETKWRSEHPDAEEDEFDEAVSKYEAELGIAVDDEDFEEGQHAFMTRPLREKIAEQERKLTEIERNNRAREVQPVAAANSVNIVKELADEFGNKDLENVLNPDGKENEDVIAKVLADDPAFGHIKASTVIQASDFARAAVLAFAGQLPEGHQSRQTVSLVAQQVEREFAEMDPSENVVNGRAFATRAQWNKMSATDRAKHWIVSPQDVIDYHTASLHKGALEDIEKEKNRLTKLGIDMTKKTATTTAATTQTTTAAPAVAKPRSPSAVDTVATTHDAGAPDRGGSFIQRMRNGTVETKRPSLLRR